MDTDTLVVDSEEQAMRDLGHEADVSQGRPVPEKSSAETPEPRAPGEAPAEAEPQPPDVGGPEQKPVSSETDTIKEIADKDVQRVREQQRDAAGKFQRPDGQRPETEYSRAQKEQERKERSWQALQAEKERFRMQTTEWEEKQRMAELERARKSYEPLKKDGLTAQEYADGAAVFEREGDYENAYKARQIAQELFHGEQGRVQQMQAVEAEYQWRQGMQTAIQMRPDIGDPNSPIATHLERIIAQNPWIYYIPNGFLRAAEVADMLTKMASLSELQDENEKLRADLERFQRKSQPARGGHAAPRTGEKDFDDMSLEEMEAHLKGVTAEADGYR